MKPPPFEYHGPDTLEEALELLARHGDEASPLAGGQSLVPALNFRLARPAVLVDLNRVGELDGIEATEDGGVRIRAMTRQRAAETSPVVARRAPLVTRALAHVAHPQIRNRGTVGGTLAHADPAAELPAVLLALGGRCRARSAAGERWIEAGEFYTELFGTVLEPEELLVEVEFPSPPPRTGWGFREIARRHGDYAMAGAAASVTLDETARCQEASLAFLGVGGAPLAVRDSVAALEGEEPTEDAVTEVAETAADREIDPSSDLHATADYRRRLAGEMARQALQAAVREARGGA